jgi:hypothetical protein
MLDLICSRKQDRNGKKKENDEEMMIQKKQTNNNSSNFGRMLARTHYQAGCCLYISVCST